MTDKWYRMKTLDEMFDDLNKNGWPVSDGSVECTKEEVEKLEHQ